MEKFIGNMFVRQGVVVHDYSPSTWEAMAGGL
jgi:hypothetical protein